MLIKSNWNYLNKELLAILSFLVISTLIAIIFLVHALFGMRQFSQQGTRAVSTAFVLQDLLTNIQDMESGSRGYVITGNKDYLDAYTAAGKRVPADLTAIHNDKSLLISDKQKQRTDDLVQQKLDIMKSVITAYQSGGYEAAEQILLTGKSEALMSQIRQETAGISSLGLQNIGPLQKRSDSNVRRALYVAVLMAILVLGTCMAVVWYFQRAILHERALESTKNEFLSLASHQLRTPATNVKQYLGLLLDGYMGDLTEQQRQALMVAYRNNESEITIMNNLLDVAKLDLERIQLHKKVVNVASLARKVVRGYAATAKEKGQTIKLEASKQVMALIDETYVRGVMENLIDNAIKYSRPDTRITVSVFRDQDSVCISVQDEGVGIRRRDFPKLFNKFSRLDNEFSANSQGSGLGLYWVKQVVELHRGEIDFTSREGKGSTFIVTLPIR